MHALVASIPSPSSATVSIGPLTIHMYGVMLLLAIFAAVWLTAVRWRAVGGEFDLVIRVTVWGVAAGVVGARLYHDLTSWNEVPSPKWSGVSVPSDAHVLLIPTCLTCPSNRPSAIEIGRAHV